MALHREVVCLFIGAPPFPAERGHQLYRHRLYPLRYPDRPDSGAAGLHDGLLLGYLRNCSGSVSLMIGPKREIRHARHNPSRHDNGRLALMLGNQKISNAFPPGTTMAIRLCCSATSKLFELYCTRNSVQVKQEFTTGIVYEVGGHDEPGRVARPRRVFLHRELQATYADADLLSASRLSGRPAPPCHIPATMRTACARRAVTMSARRWVVDNAVDDRSRGLVGEARLMTNG